MKYLAVDTGGACLTLAVYNDGKIFTYRDTEFKKTSEILLVKIDELLTQAELSVAELDYVSCVVGPGSFTGIRIGVTTVRMIAQHTNAKAISITSLEKLAYNNTVGGEVITVAHAYADNCFISDGGEILPMTYEQAAKLVASTKKSCYGDETASARLGVNGDDAIATLLAATERKIAANDYVDYAQIQPFYVLESQAERELKRKESNGANN